MKRRLMVLGMLVLFFMPFAFRVMAEETVVDDSHPVIKLVLKQQEAIRTKDYETWWDNFDSFTRTEMFGNNFDNFKKWASGFPYESRLLLEAQLTGLQVITPDRVLVKVLSPSNPKFTGPLVIKENGQWKIVILKVYFDKAKKDLSILKKAIESYLKDNGKFPDYLWELMPTYLENMSTLKDPFSDLNSSYSYKVEDGKCIIYSVGPDSKDDGGSIICDFRKGPISPGDIVMEIELK